MTWREVWRSSARFFSSGTTWILQLRWFARQALRMATVASSLLLLLILPFVFQHLELAALLAAVLVPATLAGLSFSASRATGMPQAQQQRFTQFGEQLTRAALSGLGLLGLGFLEEWLPRVLEFTWEESGVESITIYVSFILVLELVSEGCSVVLGLSRVLFGNIATLRNHFSGRNSISNGGA